MSGDRRARSQDAKRIAAFGGNRGVKQRTPGVDVAKADSAQWEVVVDQFSAFVTRRTDMAFYYGLSRVVGGKSFFHQLYEESREATRVETCPACRACYLQHAAHECVLPSHHDMEVVRSIQALCVSGMMTAEEIGEDLGVRVGWRVWEAKGDGLCGWAKSQVRWPIDAPICAVCANDKCAGRCMRVRDDSLPETRPHAFIHAAKTLGMVLDDVRCWQSVSKMHGAMLYGLSKTLKTAETTEMAIFGLVALWGDVIECERGWLATRAYPLAVQSRIWSRAYGVMELKR